MPCLLMVGEADAAYAKQNPQSARRNNFPGEQISRRFLLLSENLSASNYPDAANSLVAKAKPTVSPLLTPVSSRNTLLLQPLLTNTPFWQVNSRRRKDDPRVGPAARGIVERLSRLPRRLPSDGGSSGRVRHALSTGARDRGRPALHAPLPPGAT